MLLIIGDRIRIPMSDERLDQIARELEQAAPEGRGIWITGSLAREDADGVDHEELDAGHQRLWLHPSQIINFIYDRPRDDDPRITGR